MKNYHPFELVKNKVSDGKEILKELKPKLEKKLEEHNIKYNKTNSTFGKIFKILSSIESDLYKLKKDSGK